MKDRIAFSETMAIKFGIRPAIVYSLLLEALFSESEFVQKRYGRLWIALTHEELHAQVIYDIESTRRMTDAIKTLERASLIISRFDGRCKWYTFPDKLLRDIGVDGYDADLPPLPDSFITDKPSRVAPQAGYVYLFNSSLGFHKIGITTDINRRMADFNGMPFDIECIALIRTGDMMGLEKSLHKKFASKRTKGEWFILSSEDVEYIKSLQGGQS